MAAVEELKPTKYGFDVRRGANGVIVYPPRSYRDGGSFFGEHEIHVFRDMTDFAAWLLAQEAAL
jgi:hypothetical protein